MKAVNLYQNSGSGKSIPLVLDSPIISFLPKCTEPSNCTVTTIENYHRDIKCGRWRFPVEKVRNEPDSEKRKALKVAIAPAVTVSGQFKYKSETGLINHSGVICVDPKNIYEVSKLIKRLENDPYVYACYRSISGTSVAIEFKIDPACHRQAFYAIRKYLLAEFGIEIDNTPDVSRLRFVSYDPEIYINPDSLLFDLIVDEEPANLPVLSNIQISSSDNFNPVYNQIISQRKDITGDYAQWRDIGFALANKFGESGRAFFHGVSQFYAGYNFHDTDEQFTRCLKSSGSGITISTFFHHARTAGVNLKYNGRN